MYGLSVESVSLLDLLVEGLNDPSAFGSSSAITVYMFLKKGIPRTISMSPKLESESEFVSELRAEFCCINPVHISLPEVSPGSSTGGAERSSG